MRLTDCLRIIFQAFLFPQPCVLCTRWVVNPEFSPLCRRCRNGLRELYLPACEICGTLVPSDIRNTYVLCSDCRSQKFLFDKARAWGTYEKDLKKLIRAFKFGGWKRLAHPLSGLLQEGYQKHFSSLGIEVLVPVPLHPKRARERGFDQTALLAALLARQISVPVSNALSRIRPTSPQFGLHPEERRRNVRGAFRIENAEQFEHKKLLIVDDVMTTGATVQEISRLLHSTCHPGFIGVLAIARVSRVSSW